MGNSIDSGSANDAEEQARLEAMRRALEQSSRTNRDESGGIVAADNPRLVRGETDSATHPTSNLPNVSGAITNVRTALGAPAGGSSGNTVSVSPGDGAGQSVATGGSLASTISAATSPDISARGAQNSPALSGAPASGTDQSAAIVAALAAANAANTQNRTQTTTVAPPPPLPPTRQPLPPQPPTQQPIEPPKIIGSGPLPPDNTIATPPPVQGGITDQTGGAGPGGQDGTGGGQGGDLGSITNQLMGQIQNIGSTLANPGTPTDVTGVFLTQAQSILSMLDQQDAQLKAEADKNGTTVDPSTQFTIDKLRETLTENVKTVREDLNRRGLNDSGIELELENKLRTGSQSDQARILADRLTNIQQQLTQGLSANRAARVSTLTTFGKGAAEAQTTHDENQYKSADERERAALTSMLGLRGQVSTADTAANSEKGAMQRALLSEQGSNFRNSANNENAVQLANLNNDSAMARALATLKSGGSSSATTPTQINNPYGGSTKTGTNVDANATNQAISAIGNATSRDQAQADLFKSAQALTNAGVDVNAVQDAINSQFPESADAIRGQRRVGGSI